MGSFDMSPEDLSDKATLQPSPTQPSSTAEQSFIPAPVNSIGGVMELIIQSRNIYMAAEDGLRRALYETFPVLYDIGMRLAADAALFEEFRNHPSWCEHRGRKPKPGDQDRALNFVVMLTYGGSRQANQRASVFASALQYLAQDGVGADTLIDTIQARGGLKALASEMAARRRSKNGLSRRDAGLASPASRSAPLTQDQDTPLTNQDVVVCALAPASLAARLPRLPLYVAEAPDGSITLSAHPTQLVPVIIDAPNTYISKLTLPLTLVAPGAGARHQANESVVLVKHLEVGDRTIPVFRRRTRTGKKRQRMCRG
jgi:hypothetical protein